ncbi:MAG: DUF2461 domain-containing protein [Actinomycetota bacterium]|nr:DUF2461 domain-containing protein [Actinomycetota bacterium]
MVRSAAGAPASFAGFPAEGFELYEALAGNNTRAWWADHKADYHRFVREPMEALLAELAAEFGAGRMFRPYRDTRFSKDKEPIKDHQGGVVDVEDAMGYYVQVSASGLMAGGGWYDAQGAQLARFRESVAGPAGAELAAMLPALRRRFAVDGRQMKTRPRGYGEDHPRIELLRCRGLVATRTYAPGPSLGTRASLSKVRADWRALRPAIEWLADFVGPASDPSAE